MELTRRSVQINEDEEAIARLAPELAGMGFVKGGAFVLSEIDRFRENCTPEQAVELARRLLASNESWKSEGLTMPYWGNLVVLRTLQAEIDQSTTSRLHGVDQPPV